MIVVPLTGGSHPTRFRVPVTSKGKDGLILPDQVRVVTRLRLVKRIGVIDPASLAATLAILTEMFAT